MKIAGIVLIVLGAIALVYQVFTYTTTEKDVQLGPLQIQHQEHHAIPIPPVVGGICIVAGIVALGAGARTSM